MTNEPSSCAKHLGTPFEQLVESALHLFLLHNNVFTLGLLCGHSHSDEPAGPLATRLLAGLDIRCTVVNYFPLDPERPKGQSWDSELAAQVISDAIGSEPQTAGVIFRPTHASNISGDVFCILRRHDGEGHALVVVQCKSWLRTHDMIAQWRDGRRYFTEETVRHDGELVSNPIPALLKARGITPV